MKTLMSLTAALGVAAAAFAAPASAQTKWDMPMAYPATNFHSVNAQKFADAVKAATGGQLQITTHPGASLFKLPEIKRAVQTGQAQIGEVLDVSLENEDPVYGASGVPFLASSYAEARKLYTAQKPVVEKKLAAQGLMLLYSVPWPGQGFYAAKPINSVKDMEGLKWRAYSPATNRLGELFKAQPVTVQAAELSQALSTGKVNAMATSGATGVDSKVWEQLKYFYDAQGWQPKNMVIVNKAAFDKLDKKAQDALLAEGRKAEEAGWAASEQVAKESVETLRKNGMVVEAPSPQFKQELLAIGKIMTEEWIQKAGADGKAIVDAYRK
jgi:TRAP-type C4-dicarboxylate transport system substrate-binding protein